LWLKTQKFWLYTRRQGFGQKSFFIGNSLTIKNNNNKNIKTQTFN